MAVAVGIIDAAAHTGRPITRDGRDSVSEGGLIDESWYWRMDWREVGSAVVVTREAKGQRMGFLSYPCGCGGKGLETC
eukprot:scaffold16961_cov56-Cyclotella_meneghiniana.AAC.2